MPAARTTALCLALLAVLWTGSTAHAQGAPSAPSIASPEERPLQQVQQLVQRGELDEAMRQLDGFLKDHPKDARGRFLKGVVLAAQHRTDEAMQVYTQLTYDYPELPEPYNNLAVLVALKGEYARARELLEMAIQAQPTYATAQENLGDVYLRLAATAYGKAVSLDPSRDSARRKLKAVNDLVPAATPAAAH
jgi:tetratricopeptide (TPR) repeat protein